TLTRFWHHSSKKQHADVINIQWLLPVSQLFTVKKTTETVEIEEARDRSRRSLKTRTILLTVARKLISNPNTHATILGLIWASIRFRWGVKLPEVIDRSITILSTGGLGMAMFSLGLFMGSRSSIIACGTKMTLVAMGMKFLIGPALMAACSFPLGLRGRLLKVAIVQGTLGLAHCTAGSTGLLLLDVIVTHQCNHATTRYMLGDKDSVKNNRKLHENSKKKVFKWLAIL
ncbi:Auxin efflux carrier component 8, partial [Cucurbita argyrosperma subsp. argyrosperma]